MEVARRLASGPAGDLVLMQRMYWPNETDPTILNGSWTIPAAKKVP